MTRFTKPPWHKVRSPKEKHQDAIFITGSGPNNWVCKVYGHRGEPAEENANLLLAAPDLLAALEMLVPPVRNPKTVLESIQHYEPREIRIAREAIAKAKGEDR